MTRTEKAERGLRTTAIAMAQHELLAAIAAMERAEPGSRAETRATARLTKAKEEVARAKERGNV